MSNETKVVSIKEVTALVKANYEKEGVTEENLVTLIITEFKVGALFAVKLYSKAKKELGLTTKRLGFTDKLYTFIVETLTSGKTLTESELEAFIKKAGSANDLKNKAYYIRVYKFAERVKGGK